MLCFLGDSFAANHLREAARNRGFMITGDPEEAHIIFISQDSDIGPHGERGLDKVRELIETAKLYHPILVLTSQVPPGFTRSLEIPDIYHQAETLRVKDAAQRAAKPEQFIVGCADPKAGLPVSYVEYLMAFPGDIMKVTWEEAEFAKIAINMTLASQVENTNRLWAAASKCGADWNNIVPILQRDKRIGKHSYLEPGDWKKSQHLLRDYVTLKEIENG